MADGEGQTDVAPVASSPLPLGGVLLLAAVVRLVMLTSSTARLDGDEAVTGIMARRILEGEHRAFFAGADYMGSGEQYLQAALLAFLPDTDLVLRLPQLALAVAACALVHRVSLAIGLSANRAILAATLFAVGPFFPVYWGVKSRGAYATMLVVGLAGTLVALSVSVDDRRRLAKVAGFGLLTGVGIWANPQTLYLLLPAAWWLLASVRGHVLPSALSGAAGLVVGLSPMIADRVFGPDPIYVFSTDASFADRAAHLVDAALPDFLGIRDGDVPLFAWLPPTFGVLVVVGVVGAAVHARRRGITSVLLLRRDDRRGIDLLLLAVLVGPLLYIQSSVAIAATARYLFPFYAVLPILVASIPRPRWSTTGPMAGLDATSITVVAALLFATHTLIGADREIAEDVGGHALPSGQVVVSEDLDPVVDVLVAAGEETAYADYWISTVLTWRSEGEVLVRNLNVDRFRHINAAVDADPSPAFVVQASEIDDVVAALTERGTSFELNETPGWAVFTGIDPGIRLPAAATVAEGIRAAP